MPGNSTQIEGETEPSARGVDDTSTKKWYQFWSTSGGAYDEYRIAKTKYINQKKMKK